MRGTCWREIGIGEIKFESIFGFTSAFVWRVPGGSAWTTLVDEVTLEGPFGVGMVIGVGIVLVVVM